jgi:hypothetical protein
MNGEIIPQRILKLAVAGAERTTIKAYSEAPAVKN